jgi:hypothetical protein
LPTEEAAFDLVHEDVSAPTVLNRLPDVAFALRWRFHQVKNQEIVPSGDLSNNLLDKWFVRPSLRERPHVEQVGSGKAPHVREFTV